MCFMHIKFFNLPNVFLRKITVKSRKRKNYYIILLKIKTKTHVVGIKNLSLSPVDR